ncbi:hypothetical protein [Pseudomonas sp. 460]|uniref:hypothetical protein n=1 Tax=Pseudomonas sp. 460 TaxID=2485142 RepID=UPI0010454B48|nr:hypothetical protein [Pseudomonas sp. 460]TCV51462.1 hypothetical protein EDB99_107128 [Pseudomonas sp. 460]
MFKMLSAAIPVSIIFATLVGCAEKPVLVDNGPVRIQSSLINARLQEGWKGTVKAVSTDTHTEMADFVNASLKNAKYNVVHGDSDLTYSIREIYAGPASEYKEAHTGAGAVLATGASVALTVVTCAALNSCTSPGVLGNGVATNMTAATNAANNTNGQSVENLNKTNLVIHSICLGGHSCASSAAATSDPALSLDDLRKENAQLGLTTAMRLKSNY